MQQQALSRSARAVWSTLTLMLLALAATGAALSHNEYRDMGMGAGAVDCDGPLVVLMLCVPVLLACAAALWAFARAVWRKHAFGHVILLVLTLALGLSVVGVVHAVQEQQTPAHQESCSSGL